MEKILFKTIDNDYAYKPIEEYFKDHIESGHMLEEGTPVKCFCGSESFTDKVTDTLDGHTTLEYDRICNNCKKVIGHWAYGNWIL